MSKVYSKGFFDAKSNASSYSAHKIVPLVMELLYPQSVVDVGCGVGTWLECFDTNGVGEILGIDGEWVDPTQLRIPEQFF